jgi:hypothetical protein
VVNGMVGVSRIGAECQLSNEQRARFISSATGNVTSSSGICPVSVISLNKVKGKLPSTISDTLLLHAENLYLSASGNESLDLGLRTRTGTVRAYSSVYPLTDARALTLSL